MTDFERLRAQHANGIDKAHRDGALQQRGLEPGRYLAKYLDHHTYVIHVAGSGNALPKLAVDFLCYATAFGQKFDRPVRIYAAYNLSENDKTSVELAPGEYILKKGAAAATRDLLDTCFPPRSYMDSFLDIPWPVLATYEYVVEVEPTDDGKPVVRKVLFATLPGMPMKRRVSPSGGVREHIRPV